MKALILLLVGLNSIQVVAQELQPQEHLNDGDYRSCKNGNWNDPTVWLVWKTEKGGYAPAATYPNNFSHFDQNIVVATNLVIPAGLSVAVHDVSLSGSASLTVATGGALSSSYFSLGEKAGSQLCISGLLPTAPELSYSYQITQNGRIIIKITNVSGKLVMKETRNLKDLGEFPNINSGGLAEEIYGLRNAKSKK